MKQTFKCGNHGIDIAADDCPQCKIDHLEKEIATMRERLEELEIWKKAYDGISKSYSGKANNLGIALRRASDEIQNLEASIQKICESKAQSVKPKRKCKPKS
jgi:archaellum component FlaC